MGATRESKEARLKVFVSTYLANPDATAAARAAGYKGTDASMGVTGSRLLKTARDQGVLQGVMEKVQGKADRNLQRAVDLLWDQAEELKPAETLKDSEGKVKLLKYKPQAALDRLLTFYEPKKDAPSVNVQVVNALPPELVKQVYRALASGAVEAGKV